MLFRSGIGKSELAKNYAKAYRKDYDNIMFTTYNGSLQALINDDSKVHIANFFRYSEEEERDYFKRKLRKLKELCDSRVLFIIDNLDNSELEGEEQEHAVGGILPPEGGSGHCRAICLRRAGGSMRRALPAQNNGREGQPAVCHGNSGIPPAALA